MRIIDDWADFVCLVGLDFFVIVLGTWALPQLPEHTHTYFALAILCSAIYFTKKLIDFIGEEIHKRKLNTKKDERR